MNFVFFQFLRIKYPIKGEILKKNEALTNNKCNKTKTLDFGNNMKKA